MKHKRQLHLSSTSRQDFEDRTLNATQLALVVSGGLCTLPVVSDRALFLSTVEVAQMLGVTPQRVSQCVLDEGLPRVARNRFYLPHVQNWRRAKMISEALKMPLADLANVGPVDFSLNTEPDIELPDLARSVKRKSIARMKSREKFVKASK
jgi:hypothetical protein